MQYVNTGGDFHRLRVVARTTQTPTSLLLINETTGEEFTPEFDYIERENFYTVEFIFNFEDSGDFYVMYLKIDSAVIFYDKIFVNG